MMSTKYMVQENTKGTIEIGQGNLKLLYAADEGKLIQYVNSRNQVLCLSCFKLKSFLLVI